MIVPLVNLLRLAFRDRIWWITEIRTFTEEFNLVESATPPSHYDSINAIEKNEHRTLSKKQLNRWSFVEWSSDASRELKNVAASDGKMKVLNCAIGFISLQEQFHFFTASSDLTRSKCIDIHLFLCTSNANHLFWFLKKIRFLPLLRCSVGVSALCWSEYCGRLTAHVYSTLNNSSNFSSAISRNVQFSMSEMVKWTKIQVVKCTATRTHANSTLSQFTIHFKNTQKPYASERV